MKIDNSELPIYLNKIDEYDDTYDMLVDKNTKANLKGYLIGGGDPTSDNFKDRMRDEYHLYRQVRHMLGYLQ